jgi:hypothetical protein
MQNLNLLRVTAGSGINQIRGINRSGATGAGIPQHVTNVNSGIANAQAGSTSTVTVTFRRDPTDVNFGGVVVWMKGYQSNPSPVQAASGSDSPITFIVNNTGEAISLIVQATGNGGSAPLNTAPTTGISLPKSTGGGVGTTTVVSPPAISGSASAGQLAKFATPATTLTGANLSGDVVTSGSVATTVQKIQGTPVTSSTPLDGDLLRYSWDATDYERYLRWDWHLTSDLSTTTPAWQSRWPLVSAAVAFAAGASSTSTNVPSTATELPGTTYTTAATATNCAGFVVNNNVAWTASLGILRRSRFKLSLGSTANTRIWIGLGTQASAAVALWGADKLNFNFIGFRYSTAAGDTKYQCYAGVNNTTGNTIQAESTATHVDTNTHFFDIIYDSTPEVKYYIDGTLVGTINTNLPANTSFMTPVVMLDNVGAANAKSYTFYFAKGSLKNSLF